VFSQLHYAEEKEGEEGHEDPDLGQRDKEANGSESRQEASSSESLNEAEDEQGEGDDEKSAEKLAKRLGTKLVRESP
jgi:hypothetical protein